MPTVEKLLIDRVSHILREQHFAKIREATSLLSEEDLWAREGDVSNSIANLLLHLAGNVRQHLIAGVGGAKDIRDRPAEFAARSGPPKAELLDRLERTLTDAIRVLEGLSPASLLERRVIQGKEVLVVDDILQVTEHFAYHVGQIVYRVKALKQHSFPWFKHLDPPAR